MKKFLNKILLKIILILILILIILFSGKFTFRKISEIKTEKTHALIFRELTKCSELVCLKNTYTDIISIKKTRIAGFAKTFSIIKYSGTIRAGISDITKSEISISKSGKKISVTIPKPEILSNDISTMEVFDESKSIFVSISVQEILSEIRFNQETAAVEIIETGFLDEAETQAVKIIQTMLEAAGFEEVNVTCSNI